MGILDDAIRQHLELKRQHGAEGSDLERLEKEAFGPATRPGDPEFVDPDAPAAEAAPAPETTVAPTAGATASDATAVAPVEQAAGVPTDPRPDQPSPIQLGPEAEAEASPSEPPPAPAVSAPAAGEPGASPPSATPTGDAAPVVPAPEQSPVTDPPEAPESSIFDAEDFDVGDLDLDLGEEEELPSGSLEGEPAPAKEPTLPVEPPAAAPTTDHDLPPAPVAPPPAPPPVEEPPAPAPTEGGPPGTEKGASPPDEDLLEETPDFLQSAPEGEDLWFEQGPPRDFDFDDD